MKSMKDIRKELEKGVSISKGGEQLELRDISLVSRPNIEILNLNEEDMKSRNKEVREYYRGKLKNLQYNPKEKKEYEQTRKELERAIRNAPRKLTLAEGKKLMAEMPKEEKMKRGLLAQMYKLFRRSFPAEERQYLSDFKWEYEQNLLPSRDPEKKEHYDLISLNDKKGNMKGFIGVSSAAKGSKAALVGYIVVDPKERGKGFSKDLYEKAIEVAKSRGSKFLVAEIESYGQKEKAKYKELAKKQSLNEEEKREKAELNMKKTRILAQGKYYKKVEGIEYIQPPVGNQTKALKIDLYVSYLDRKNPDKMSKSEVLGIIDDLYSQTYDLPEGKRKEFLKRVEKSIGNQKYVSLVSAEKSLGK